MSVLIDQNNIFNFFSEMKDEFIIELELNQKDPKTIDAYQVIIDNFLAYVYNYKPISKFEELNHRCIIAFIRTAEDNYRQISNKSFTYWTNSSYKKAIKLFINFIEEEIEITTNIKWNKIQFKKEQKEVKSIADDNINKILKYLTSLYKYYSKTKDKSKLSKEIKSLDYIYTINMAFKLALYTGLRANEICNLKLSSFFEINNQDENQIVEILVEGKGHKQRIVPILYKHICKELEYFKSNRSLDEILLKQINGNNLSRYSLYRYLEKLYKAAEVESRGVHILRHTCTMRMRENGVDLADAQDFLGHSDPKVTRIYFKRSNSRMRQVAAII